MRTLLILVTFTCAAFAQRHKLEEVDSEKPEGKLLQQIMQESDAAKRVPLLEQFASQYPRHEGAAWALEQLQQSYAKANDFGKVLATGDKLLAIDPDDPEANLQNLKAAQNKKDVALIKKYGASTAAAARKLSDAEAENAKYFQGNADFVVYASAAESRDPKAVIELGEALRTQSPKGEYTAKVTQPLFIAYQQSGDRSKALALAEQTLATDQSSEDMLLVVADNYAQQKREPQKVHDYSARAAELMASRPKPEGVSDADWTKRKNGVTGVARYINGKLYYNETNFAKADSELSAALPVADPALKAEILYMLGFANYKLDKPQDAANYYKACAAIPGQFQALANKNLTGIRTQYHGIK
jgi:lipopolysaccharide biosynthesis regulator YciM